MSEDMISKPDPAATEADKQANLKLVVDLTKGIATTALTLIPQYRSHKIVRAFKIKKIEADADRALKERRETDANYWVVPEDQSLPQVKVGPGYVQRHMPKFGGYFVIYDDNYFSFSPAEPFEKGYDLLPLGEEQITEASKPVPAKIGDTEVTHGIKVRSKASGKDSPVMTVIHGSPDKTAWSVEWHHEGQRIVRPADFNDLELVK